MVSCQKGPTRHAYAWQIEPFWQDTLECHQAFVYLSGDCPMHIQHLDLMIMLVANFNVFINIMA